MRVLFLIPVSSHAVLIGVYHHFRPLEFLYLQINPSWLSFFAWHGD